MRVSGGLAEGVGTPWTRMEVSVYVDADVGADVGVCICMCPREAIIDVDWCAGTCL